jgi:hypothetical protein
MEAFRFTPQDLDANRAGRMTARQRILLITSEAPRLAGCAALCAVLGIGGAIAGVFLFLNPRPGLPHPGDSAPIEIALFIALIGLLGLGIVIALGRGLVDDLMHPRIVGRPTTMEVTRDDVRIRRVGTAGFVIVDVSGGAHRRLLELQPSAFECILYRTGNGLHILSVELR